MHSASEITLPDGLTRLEQGLVYAARLHDGHTRKGTTIPYFSHLTSVAALVLEQGGNEDQMIAALLHDAVEDRGGRPTLEDIRRRFGDVVAGIVEGCSDDDESGARDFSTWRRRKERYLAHLTKAPKEVRLVSAADKLHNARAILADYRVLGDALWARFNAKRDDILWYYRGLVEIFRVRGPEALAAELARVVDELGRVSQASQSAT
jgi:GTP pyrophosphokinase